ncbi:MAG: thioredoxin domain-containing protein [Gammaproteobacteria bacterium]|nr:thioredoxin domain-containing protein [Gammaproteobacteria bacterium]
MVDSINSPYIHAANADNFQSLVIENSKRGPVLVNFWSKKAGPCLRQYPLLDKLVHDYKERLLLINIDVDSELKITRELCMPIYRNTYYL